MYPACRGIWRNLATPDKLSPRHKHEHLKLILSSLKIAKFPTRKNKAKTLLNMYYKFIIFSFAI